MPPDTLILRSSFFQFPRCTCHIPPFLSRQALQTSQLPGLSDFHKSWLKHFEFISLDNPSVASKNCGEQFSKLLLSVCFKIISATEMYLYSVSVCWGRWTQTSDFPEQSTGSQILWIYFNNLFYDNSFYWGMLQKRRKTISIVCCIMFWDSNFLLLPEELVRTFTVLLGNFPLPEDLKISSAKGKQRVTWNTEAIHELVLCECNL